MASKTVLNSDELEEYLKCEVQKSEYERSRLSKKFKNSLDSDEEDDEAKAKETNILNPEEFDGQEEATIDHDGETKITPFNMKEELEEGYFDKDGTYIFQKNEDEIKDQWLDDIDWVKVKSSEGVKRKIRHVSESDSDDLPELDVIGHYKKMLNIMASDETVQKAICRLGSSSRSRNARRNRKAEVMNEQDMEKLQRDKEKLQELTALASELLQNGDTDIYQQTYEKLSFLVKASEEPKQSLYETSDSADMFADNFDEKLTSQDEVKKESNDPESSSLNSEVMWEFKWEQKDDAPVYGPHSTSEMLNWVQEGYFTDGVYVRRAGKTDSEFYSSKRIDFELYL